MAFIWSVDETTVRSRSMLATFLGETWEEEAAYVRRENQPAFVLVREAWRREAIEDIVYYLKNPIGAG